MLGFTSVITHAFNTKSGNLNYKHHEIFSKIRESYSNSNIDSEICFSSNNIISSNKNLAKSSESPPMKKKISFCNTCRVVLIPSRQEYAAAGIDLWLKDDDYNENKLYLLRQVQEFLRRNPFEDKREAIKKLIEDPIRCEPFYSRQ